MPTDSATPPAIEQTPPRLPGVAWPREGDPWPLDGAGCAMCVTSNGGVFFFGNDAQWHPVPSNQARETLWRAFDDERARAERAEAALMEAQGLVRVYREERDEMEDRAERAEERAALEAHAHD